MATSSGVTDPSSAPLTIAAFPTNSAWKSPSPNIKLGSLAKRSGKRWNFCQKAKCFRVRCICARGAVCHSPCLIWTATNQAPCVWTRLYVHEQLSNTNTNTNTTNTVHTSQPSTTTPWPERRAPCVWTQFNNIYKFYRSRYYICNENAINSLHRSQKDWYL